MRHARMWLLSVLVIGVCGMETLSAQSRNPNVSIRKVQGVPRIFVDDRPVPMLTYRNRIHDDFAYMKNFADAGVELFFMTHLIDWQKSLDDHFNEVRRRLDGILDLNDRTVVILGMFVGCPPQWGAENPDELQWQDGKPLGARAPGSALTAPYSLASRKFEAEGVKLVNRHLDFLEKYPRRARVIGLFFEGGAAQEWGNFRAGRRYIDHPDTGPAMLKAYREYACNKYKTDAALAKAYGRRGLTFRTLQIPDADLAENPDVGDFFDPGKSLALHDFWRTQAKETADRMLALGHAAKKRAPWLLTGLFHEFLMDESKTGYENRRILTSPDLDFFAGPPAYEMRGVQDHQPIHHVVDSVLSHGKIFFVEEDLRPGMGVRPPEAPRNRSAQVVADTIATYQRDVLHDQTKGVYAWIWDFQFKWFDNEPAYFDAFHKLQQVGLLNIKAESRSVSEICVLVDETSKYLTRGDNRLMRSLAHRQFIAEMGSLGAPYDIWLQEDIDREDFPLDRYKLIVVFNCYRLNDADRKRIERLKAGGRTVVWLHGQGFINEDRDPALSVNNMTELTGFHFGRYDQRLATTVVVPDSNNELTRLFPLGAVFGQFYRMIGNGRQFPIITRVAPVFAVEDPAAIPAGWYSLENIGSVAETSTGTTASADSYGGNYYVGFAYRKFPEWTSVYAGVVAVPSQVIRILARFAGVHLYIDNDDLLYANNRMVVLQPRHTAGPRTLRLPEKTLVFDALDDMKPLTTEPVTEFTVDGPLNRPRAFWLADQPPTLPTVP